MAEKWGIKIIGTGSCLPDKILTNADLERMVDTSDEWIVSRTGIKERRIADDKTATSDLAIGASKAALEQANIKPEDIDLIMVATITPDMMFPSTACFVQEALGAKNAAAFDISAACSGFIYGLSIAKSFIENSSYKTILLIGAETLSKITDWNDRNTCVLFGDGAGAVVLQKQKTSSNILSVYLGSDGRYKDILKIPGGGSRFPITKEIIKNKLNFIKMEGNEVFKLAVQRMLDSARLALEMAQKKCDDLSLVIPHQANIRIIEALAKRMKIPMNKVFLNIHKYGNVSAATTVIGLDEANRSGLLKEGDLVELVAFGAGLTWAASIIEW
ncbi:MAG: beta-ketoacyl-ACP synthase III [bacterium]